MRLTTQTDYALRTLMYLATRETRANVAGVASLFNISVNHVAKVVNVLAREGYVRSIRGVGGGIELAVRPEDVTVGQIIATVESDMHLLPCVAGDHGCVIHSFCKLTGVLANAERIQMDYLNSVTLADVIPTRKQLDRTEAS
ncbi:MULTISPECIES: RrF2 family transcriptional regulator [Rhodopirellula]|uniref:Transcriptional regulator, Rrf2 n=2 Tax=Rhodopirellula europaea TaxID=1263866 RepID=M2B7G1_9BACT|nr:MULTISPECIES: Rrf2 family transcriptional regulator [Rhodopirellula]EMB17663.1 Transcriptional regulator, Rrf2 [Rhodopirellula europaea 6C]EMI23634.1 Transcriptional regulator, Rrf2 [Rhodopirellula europaea SH398]